jgi:hypothetical protein
VAPIGVGMVARPCEPEQPALAVMSAALAAAVSPHLTAEDRPPAPAPP